METISHYFNILAAPSPPIGRFIPKTNMDTQKHPAQIQDQTDDRALVMSVFLYACETLTLCQKNLLYCCFFIVSFFYLKTSHYYDIWHLIDA